jgi:hypothetical protein
VVFARQSVVTQHSEPTLTLCWRFRRGEDILDVSRASSPDATRLIIEGPSGFRILDLASHQALVTAQGELESHLVADGWTFEAFLPERRHSTMPNRRNIERRRHP